MKKTSFLLSALTLSFSLVGFGALAMKHGDGHNMHAGNHDKKKECIEKAEKNQECADLFKNTPLKDCEEFFTHGEDTAKAKCHEEWTKHMDHPMKEHHKGAHPMDAHKKH